MAAMRNVGKPQKAIHLDAAYLKIIRYCAYQERSHHEVREKLFVYGLYPSQAETLIARVITEGYLNEERFAKAFAGGKFRMKSWGKKKISRALESHGLTKKCIESGLREIDDIDYSSTLSRLIEKKWHQLADKDLFIKKDKVARYAMGKGYEPDLVWGILKGMKD